MYMYMVKRITIIQNVRVNGKTDYILQYVHVNGKMDNILQYERVNGKTDCIYTVCTCKW